MHNWNTLKRLELPNLRKAMKGMDCTLNTPVCNYDSSTVVGCHINTEGGKMGGKSDDTIMVAGCSDCHSIIDKRVKCHHVSDADIEFYKLRGITRTFRMLFGWGD